MEMSRLAIGPRIGRLLAASALLLVGACGESDSSGPTTAPSGPTTTPSDTSKPPTVPAKISYIYLADADGTVRGRVNVASPDGSSVKLLLTPTVHILSPLETGVGFPAWSPDGALLVFETLSIDDNAKIVIVSADGTGEHRLTRSSESEFVDEDGPAWSPDGSQITYWRLDWITDSRSKDAGLTTVDRSGGDQRRLDVGDVFASFASRPTWLPDGRSIAFTLNGSVVTVPSTGGIVRTLILDGMHAAWSPDAKRIAFVRTVER
jgi:Tol biopolymer transport system component